jgi:hypothetical protein
VRWILDFQGTAAEQWASQGVPKQHLLAKPFAAAQLVTAISQLLNFQLSWLKLLTKAPAGSVLLS